MNSDDEQAQDVEARRQRSAQLFGSEPLTFIQTVRKEEMANPDAQQQQVYPPASLPHQRFMMADGLLGTNLNAAYDAASYGNTNWDQFNFSTEEMDMFDVYMSNSGWMGYLL